MRYITYISNYRIQQRNGKISRSAFGTPLDFGPQGVLIVGDNSCTATGYRIDFTPDSVTAANSIQKIYPKDLAGADTSCPEICGLGTLTTTRVGGAATATLPVGRRGMFFEAPSIDNATNVPNVAGIYYEVLTGSITYNSVVYTKGQQFVTVGGGTVSTAGTTGTFALTIPPALSKKCDEFLDEQFKIKHLIVGDESSSYFDWNNGGFEPRDSQDSTDTNFYGWTE